MPDDDSYDVGFGKPPKHSRFRKGVSGNPKGRPKGRRNLATIFRRALQEKVVINENGIRRTVTKFEAAIMQLVNKSASGDPIALRQFLVLAGSTEEQTVLVPTKQLADADQKVMESVLKRIKGESSEN